MKIGKIKVNEAGNPIKVTGKQHFIGQRQTPMLY